jgi:O-antigen/teichoic acid export membrane protein
VSAPTPRPVDTQGPVRNTIFQLAAQLTTGMFTAGLTVYLVRALGASGYGTFTLAVGVGALVWLPSDFGLAAAVARFVAERREDSRAVSGILARGLNLKLIGGIVASLALFASAPAIAAGYGDPGLVWPLRWISVAMFGQGLVYFFSATFAAVRNVASSLKMIACESAMETAASVALVLAGTGIAGAALGRAIGYLFGGMVGLVLATRIGGSLREAWGRRRTIAIRSLTRFAGAMMIVDTATVAIAQVDILLIGAILGVAAAGPFGAATRLITVLGYLGNSVAAGVAPRLATSTSGGPDTRSFGRGLRFVIVFQGILLAPLFVWAKPIVSLVLGPGYGASVGVVRALAPMAILGGLAPVLSIGVNYLGEARRRVPIMIGTFFVGLVATYTLLKAVGLARNIQ